MFMEYHSQIFGLQDATGHLQEFQQRLYEPRFAKTTLSGGQTHYVPGKNTPCLGHRNIKNIQLYHVIPCYTMLYLEKIGHTVILYIYDTHDDLGCLSQFSWLLGVLIGG